MKRMEDKQPGKEGAEQNYIPNYQCHSVEKHFYSTQNSLSSNENDTIVETKTKDVKPEESSCSSSSKNELQIHVETECIDYSKSPSSFDREEKQLIADKVIGNEKVNLDTLGSVKDDLKVEKENQYAEEKVTEPNITVDIPSNKFLLNKVSPLHSLNPDNYLGTENIERKNTTYSTSAEVDYISETYRNIVKQINDVSEGFKKGKKWKCNNPSHCHHHHNHRHYHQPHCRQYITPRSYYKSKDVILEHSKETLMLKNQKMRGIEDSIVVSPLSDSVFEAEGSEGRERVLVRQMATEHSQDYEPEDIDYYDVDEDIAIVIESESNQKTHRYGNQRFILMKLYLTNFIS